MLHTGDWKIDPTPVIGPPTDEKRLRALGEEGCLALLGDSTNAVREGRSPSETDVAKVLADLIRNAPGRVGVTTFASNVARIRAVAEAAATCGREVVLVGRAMERVAQVARETGYLDDIREFRSLDTYGYLPPDKVVALCTGSQGEPRAALARIAEDQHPLVTFSKGDRVIFSSRAIPGNEKSVMRIINGLVSQGVEVITDRTHLVHVSGHPRRAELEEMISWVRPQILIPVHGETLHMAEHAGLARRAGVGKVLTCRNGDLVKLAPAGPEIIDEVPAGRLYKDGSLLVDAAERTVPDRRRLGFAGIVSVALAMTDRGELVGEPEIQAFLDQIEQVVRLVRSKGVGVFFVTQSPKDVPADILGQLGNRVQHALRAFTPDDEKALRAAARTFPKTELYDVEETLTTLGIGEALVTVLDSNGAPTPPFATRMMPPESRMGPLTDAEIEQQLAASAQVREYAQPVDRESARELLAARMDDGGDDDASPAPAPIVVARLRGTSRADGRRPPARTHWSRS